MEIKICIDDDMLYEYGYTHVVHCRKCIYSVKKVNVESWDNIHTIYTCSKNVYPFQICGNDYCCMGREEADR